MSAGVVALVLALSPPVVAVAAGRADEIHYSYGGSPTSVVVDWHGGESMISYGVTAGYGFTAVASAPTTRPTDSPGPFREVTLSGLAPDTAYHYRIGNGPDYRLRTAPLGSFRWVDVGDTASTRCKKWVGRVHAMIADLEPRFVTHGGDISEANVCGMGGVHQYYDDQQVWSTSAAFQPVWGNHEYGYPDQASPGSTPRDSLANYKGRSFITHGGSVPLNDRSPTVPPGCPGAGSANGCPGEDWGWFRAGAVLFISYPEIFAGALESWEPSADKLMARAQADPTVDFIVTYGHRPAYSSLGVNGWDPTVRTALNRLAEKYSPRTAHSTGKYVLNLAHHVHGLEVFNKIHGLIHITNAGGGQGTVRLRHPAKGSALRFPHLGVMAGDYDAASHRLSLRWVCGPSLGTKAHSTRARCGYGDTVWSMVFTAAHRR